jgi:hypothetical protein
VVSLVKTCWTTPIQSERCPVELVVRDESEVFVAAAAGEADAEHGWAGGAWQPVDFAEGGQSDARLALGGAGECVPGRQRVVHVAVVFDSDEWQSAAVWERRLALPLDRLRACSRCRCRARPLSNRPFHL